MKALRTLRVSIPATLSPLSADQLAAFRRRSCEAQREIHPGYNRLRIEGWSSLLMAITGSMESGPMQMPTTTIRLLTGAEVMIWSRTPGNPTHSKITEGRNGGPGIHGGSSGASGPLHIATSLHLFEGESTDGATTMSAPSSVANCLRVWEKSAATIG